jgi:hypothetical protein
MAFETMTRQNRSGLAREINFGGRRVSGIDGARRGQQGYRAAQKSVKPMISLFHFLRAHGGGRPEGAESLLP